MLLQLIVFTLVITGLAFSAMSLPKYKRVQLDGGMGHRVVKLPNALIVILIAILLIGISGHRGYAYQDTGEYVYSYHYDLTSNYRQKGGMFDGSDLFWFIAASVREITNINDTWFLMVFAILTIAPIVWTFYRYSERFEISIFLFLTFGSYLVSMNAMRQCIASAVMFCGYKLFMNKRWLLFFILVGIGYFMHPTAVVMIPIFYYCHRPAWQPLATGIIVAIVLALMFVPSFAQMLFSMLGDSSYSQYENLSGANIFRPLIMLALCVFAFVNRQKLHDAFPQSDILVNMLVVHTVILFAATNSFVIARLSIYTDVYVAMLVPMLCIACFNKQNRRLGIALIMLFFMAYHLYEYRELDYYSKTLNINYH